MSITFEYNKDIARLDGIKLDTGVAYNWGAAFFICEKYE